MPRIISVFIKKISRCVCGGGGGGDKNTCILIEYY